MRSSRDWFVSRNGQVQGPVSTANIRDRLAQGELTPLDQICQAGGASDLQWKLIFECPEFILPASTPNAGAGQAASSGNMAAEWVLLRQTTSGQFSLKRSGPYTSEDISLMLREGSITYADYVWKKGYQRWAQLETLREFNHMLPPELPKLELVAKMPPPLMTYDRVLADSDEPPATHLVTHLATQASDPLTSQRAGQSAGASEGQGASIWARVGVAMIIAIGVMLALASLRSQKKTLTQTATHLIGLNDDSPVTVAGDGYLKIYPLTMETHPKLEFEMSAPMRTFLQVQITGHAGQILHRVRFAQTVSLQKKGAEAPVLDLTPLGLTDGTYDIRVSDGQITTEQQVFVGTHNDEFDRQLAAHRVEVERAQLRERKAVYEMAQNLTTMVDRVAPSGQVAAADWSETYQKWMSDFKSITRAASLDQTAALSAEPALLQAAQGVAQAIQSQMAEFDLSIRSQKGDQAVLPAAALKKELRRLQVQASKNP